VRSKGDAAVTQMDSLERLLEQPLPIRFLEWAMTQADKFYMDPSGLWNTLFRREVRLSNEQMAALLAMRSEVLAQRLRLAQARAQLAAAGTTGAGAGAGAGSASAAASAAPSLQQMFAVFSQLTRLQMQHAEANTQQLRAIMSPMQIARYFDWVQRFGAICIQINV
jgi:hypothetical protein